MQRSVIATRKASYDFREYGNDFRKKGSEQKRANKWAFNLVIKKGLNAGLNAMGFKKRK
jgi:hypothetical protein